MYTKQEIEEAINQFKKRLEITDYINQIPEYYKALEIAIDSLEMDLKRRSIVEDDGK